MKNNRKFYIGCIVYGAVLGFFAFNPLFIGFDLMHPAEGVASEAEKFFGCLIWFCTALALTLIEIAVFVSFKFLKPKKKPYLLWTLMPFAVVLLMRIGYAYLQSWVK